MKLGLVFAGVAVVAGCKDEATKRAGAGDVVGKMTELRDKMCACKDADCARRVSDEMSTWSQQREAGKLAPDEQKRATELGNETGECMKRAMTGTSTTPPADATGSAASARGSADDTERVAGSAASAGSAAAGDVPPECLEYKAAIDRLATCDKLAKQARETLIKAYNDQAPTWASLPESSKANIAQTCKAGADSVVAVAKRHCGW